eukprot:TRINITY_DN553_c0_g1_i1.p1 TRINITY_DN553_c0_g1~~TRINITY_DN553_c0_g1_i1.p1  ORF type:complete len:403 (+),score=75.71 TRINITY_DN553_c0_g1_i1:521-1729(+)
MIESSILLMLGWKQWYQRRVREGKKKKYEMKRQCVIFALVLVLLLSSIFFHPISLNEVNTYHYDTPTSLHDYPTIPPDPPLNWSSFGQNNYPTIPPDPPLNWSSFGQDDIDCNYTITYVEGPGGFSPRFRCLLGTLTYAKNSSRTLLIDYKLSSFGTWNTFFEEIPSMKSHCTQPDLGTMKNLVVDKANPTYPHLYEAVGLCHGEWLPGAPGNHLHLSSTHLWRFNRRTRWHIEEILSDFPQWNVTRYNAIHFRRGDKNFGPAKEAYYVPTETYLEFLENTTELEVDKVPLFVAADSIDSVMELKKLRPHWNLWYIQREEFNEMRKGNYSTSAFLTKPARFRSVFALYFFAEMVMMQHSQTLVCTFTSNVCHLQEIIRGEKQTLFVPETRMPRRKKKSKELV